MRVLVVACLLAGLLGTGAASAQDGGQGFKRITFEADCVDVSGHLAVREVRGARDHMLVSLRATGLPVTGRRWSGETVIQKRRYAVADTFWLRAPEGRGRHTTVFDVPIASTPVTATLMDIDGEDQQACGLYVAHTATSAWVAEGISEMRAYTDDGDLVVGVRRACARGTTWRGRLVATWPDHVVRKALTGAGCRSGYVGLGRELRGERLPRALAVRLHDDVGHTWRASHGIGR